MPYTKITIDCTARTVEERELTAEEEATEDQRRADNEIAPLEAQRAALLAELDRAMTAERAEVRRELGVDDSDLALLEEAQSWIDEYQADPGQPEPPAGTYPTLEAERDGYNEAGRNGNLVDTATRVLRDAAAARGRQAELRKRETRLRVAIEEAGDLAAIANLRVLVDGRGIPEPAVATR